ncbi:TPA: hypothetical protein HA337_05335 [Desulfurococcaceae archaeon]|nr:hypothetical protein [Desulfurococcaceae archaeon]
MKKSRAEFVLPVWLERSKSKSGKHAFLRLAFVVDHSGRVVAEYQPPEGKPEVYSRGRGGEVSVPYKGEEVVVVLELKKNARDRVSGSAEVYDRGKLVYKASYRKLKLRSSYGDPAYHYFVSSVFKYLNLPVKRENPFAHLGGSRRRDEGHTSGLR